MDKEGFQSYVTLGRKRKIYVTVTNVSWHNYVTGQN